MTSAAPAPPSRKRKATESSDDEDDVPLASSQPTAHRSVAVPMPGAAAATTVSRGSLSPLNGKGNLKPAKWDTASEESEDDIPLAMASSAPPTPAKRRSNGNGHHLKEESSEDEDEAPVVTKAKAKPARATKRRKTIKEESESEDDTPLQETPKPKPKPKAAPKQGAKRVKKEEDDSGAEDVKPKKRARVKKEDKESVKEEKAKAKKEKEKAKKEKEEEEIHRWWEESGGMLGDGTQKWTTLEHSGVLFAPPYEPLPKNARMKYNGNASIHICVNAIWRSCDCRQACRPAACSGRGGRLLRCHGRHGSRQGRDLQPELLL